MIEAAAVGSPKGTPEAAVAKASGPRTPRR